MGLLWRKNSGNPAAPHLVCALLGRQPRLLANCWSFDRSEGLRLLADDVGLHQSDVAIRI